MHNGHRSARARAAACGASVLAAALLAGLAASPAMAQYQGQVYQGQASGVQMPGIDQSQRAIAARIEEGLGSGQITPSEAQILYRRDREIDIREARFKSDGRATPQERQQLRADVAGLSAEVERMIANREVVARPRPGAGNAFDRADFQISRRIDQGVRTGRISQLEAARLHAREREIDRREAAFRADGVVTVEEGRQLRYELTALRDDVERMIRDGRRG
ncbi:MAG: hypothetical protein EOO28_03170 [Comamonadaceae bacterium]|nr:MAG: hypothetical protein EOO28_03170 [Comamonadaceae bacterium]